MTNAFYLSQGHCKQASSKLLQSYQSQPLIKYLQQATGLCQRKPDEPFRGLWSSCWSTLRCFLVGLFLGSLKALQWAAFSLNKQTLGHLIEPA